MTGDADSVGHNDSIAVRHQLRPGDLGAILALHGALYAREFGFDLTFEGYVARTLSRFESHFDPERERIWVAESGTEIAGCIGVVRQDYDCAQIRWFLVAQAFRGRGLGRRLLQGAVGFARDAGFSEAFLETVDGLETAAHLYRFLGFALVSERKTLLGGRTVTEQRYELKLRS